MPIISYSKIRILIFPTSCTPNIKLFSCIPPRYWKWIWSHCYCKKSMFLFVEIIENKSILWMEGLKTSCNTRYFDEIHVISMHFPFLILCSYCCRIIEVTKLRIELSLSKSRSSIKVVRLSLSKSASGHRVPTTDLVLINSHNSQRDSYDVYFDWPVTLFNKVFFLKFPLNSSWGFCSPFAMDINLEDNLDVGDIPPVPCIWLAMPLQDGLRPEMWLATIFNL